MRRQNTVTIGEARHITGIGGRAFYDWIRAGRCPLLKEPLQSERGANRTWLLSKRQIANLVDIIARLPLASDGRVEDAAGSWVTAAAIERDYNLPVPTLRRWGSDWPPLGRHVNARKQFFKLRDGKLQKFPVYLENDVAETVAARLKGSGTPDGYMALEDAARETGSSANAIYQQIRAGRCPTLNRAWKYKMRRAPMKNDSRRWRKTHFVSVSDVEETKRLNAEPLDGWRTLRQVERDTGYSAASMRKQWCEGNKICPPLGYELRREKRRRPDCRGYFKEQWLVHPDDAKKLRRFRETKGQTGEPGDGWMAIRQARIESGYSRNSFFSWIWNGWCPPLERKLRCEKRRLPNRQGRVRDSWVVHPDDVSDLCRASRAAGNGQESPRQTDLSKPQARRGRPKNTERDQQIRKRAKSDGLEGQPAELTRRLNADGDFVGQFGKVTKGMVKAVFRRSNARAQKS